MTGDSWSMLHFGAAGGFVLGVLASMFLDYRARKRKRGWGVPPPKPKRPPGMPRDGSRTSPGQRPGDDGPKPKHPPTEPPRERRCHTEPVEDPLETVPLQHLRRPRKWPDPPPDPNTLIEPSTPPPEPPPDPPRRTPDDYAPAAPEHPGPSHPSPAKQGAERSGHPEATCDDCGRPNINWVTPSDRWNHAFERKPGESPNPVLCPVCFVRRWERATGLTASWWLDPDPRAMGAADRHDVRESIEEQTAASSGGERGR